MIGTPCPDSRETRQVDQGSWSLHSTHRSLLVAGSPHVMDGFFISTVRKRLTEAVLNGTYMQKRVNITQNSYFSFCHNALRHYSKLVGGLVGSWYLIKLVMRKQTTKVDRTRTMVYHMWYIIAARN